MGDKLHELMPGPGNLIQLSRISLVRNAEKIGETKNGSERHAHVAREFLKFSTGFITRSGYLCHGLAQAIAQLVDLAFGLLELALNGVSDF
jgi:hypothetical protein